VEGLHGICTTSGDVTTVRRTKAAVDFRHHEGPGIGVQLKPVIDGRSPSTRYSDVPLHYSRGQRPVFGKGSSSRSKNSRASGELLAARALRRRDGQGLTGRWHAMLKSNRRAS